MHLNLEGNTLIFGAPRTRSSFLYDLIKATCPNHVSRYEPGNQFLTNGKWYPPAEARQRSEVEYAEVDSLITSNGPGVIVKIVSLG